MGVSTAKVGAKKKKEKKRKRKTGKIGRNVNLARLIQLQLINPCLGNVSHKKLARVKTNTIYLLSKCEDTLTCFSTSSQIKI